MIKVRLSPTQANNLRADSPLVTINSNVAGFIGWDRLMKSLRATGEFRHDESVEGIYVTDDGIQFFTEKT